MTQKLVLNTGQLDVDFVYATYGIILDDAIQAKLDESALNPQSSFNYGNATNSLSALAIANAVINVSGESNLGAINSLSLAVVAHLSQGATNLGSLDATANTVPTILPIFDATLGALTSSANAVIQIVASAQATLGSLSAASQSVPEVEITAQATLGSLTATAQSSTPEPPTPVTPKYGSNGYVPIKKKQKKQRPTPIIVPEIVDIPELPPLIKSVFASASADNISELFASAENRIDFSILRDEQELMMLL